MNIEPQLDRPPLSPDVLQLDSNPLQVPIEIDLVENTAAASTIVRETTTVPLLAERLEVDYQRRKVGEITVRKKIETRVIQVPVRYETLIIEQVSPEPKLIAEINLADEAANQAANQAPLEAAQGTIQGTFTSPRVASQMLYELGKSLHHTCRQIRVEIVLEDANLQETYQQWLDTFIQNSYAD
jgi:hypothetical protein